MHRSALEAGRARPGRAVRTGPLRHLAGGPLAHQSTRLRPPAARKCGVRDIHSAVRPTFATSSTGSSAERPRGHSRRISSLPGGVAGRIVDWYHTAEHAWGRRPAGTGGRALGPGAAWSCCASTVGSLLGYLRRSRRAREDAAAQVALAELIGCLEPRVAFVEIYEYRAGDYVIGSGIMEATCKQVFGQRLKGSGRQWSAAGAVGSGDPEQLPPERGLVRVLAHPRPSSGPDYPQPSVSGRTLNLKKWAGPA